MPSGNLPQTLPSFVDFSNVSNRERTPFQSPVAVRPSVPLAVQQRALVLHGLQESLACVADLQALVATGRDVTTNDLNLLETRLRATKSALCNVVHGG